MQGLSFSTNAFVGFTVFEAVEKIAAAGYDGVEILADVPHLYAPRVTGFDLKQLKTLLRESGIRAANINANTAIGYYGREFWEPLFEPSLANPDASARKWRVEYSKKCIEIALALECRNVSVTSGKMVPGISPDRSMDLLRQSLGEVLRHAEACGVRVAMEYEPGLLIERYEELNTLIHEMGSPLFGANLDLGHSHVLGEDPREVIGSLSSRIFHVHVEDIRDGKHYHLIPGLGDMDFGLLFGALDRNGYDGFVTVELYTYPHQPEEAAAKSLAHLGNLVRRESKDKP